MMEIRIQSGQAQVFGSLDLGYMGRYTDEQISLYDEDVGSLRRWWTVRDRVGEDASDEIIAACLTEYFNAFAEKIEKNRKQVNDQFLVNVFESMESCAFPFWEIKGLTRREFLPPDPEKSVYQPHWEESRPVIMAYWRTPNDGSLDKPDVEVMLRRDYPMLDLDALLASIVPEHAILEDGRLSFQCSDGFDEAVLCCAFDTMDEELTFLDWHNF